MKDEIQNVSKNARIKLDKSELEDLIDDFDEVLEMFDTLDDIETKDVQPSFHPSKTKSKTRKDKIEETVEKPFENTENSEDGFFKGPSA